MIIYATSVYSTPVTSSLGGCQEGDNGSSSCNMVDANGRVAFRNQAQHSSDSDGNLEATFEAIARSVVISPC